MKLLLALSVVFIALSVLAGPSSAEPQESSLKDHFKNIRDTLKGAFVHVGEKTKETYENLRDSEFGQKTRELFSGTVQKLKDSFSK